jgi:hypothetical protein
MHRISFAPVLSATLESRLSLDHRYSTYDRSLGLLEDLDHSPAAWRLTGPGLH